MKSTAAKVFSLTSNTFSGNAALNGGSVYCSYCDWTLSLNSFTLGIARYGGDMFIADPVSQVTVKSHSHSYGRATIEGAFIRYSESRSIATTFTINAASGGTSSYTYGVCDSYGGVSTFGVIKDLTLVIDSTTISNNQA